LNETLVLGLVAADDGEIIILDQFVAVCRYSLLHVFGTSLLDDIGRNSQPNFAIDCPISRLGVVFRVGTLGDNLITEETSRIRSCVCDQRFLQRKL